MNWRQLMERPEWMRRAACAHANTDLWFPPRGDDASRPKAVCAGCPVRAECLAYAMNNGEKHGVWGGLSERERRRLRSRRRTAGSVPS